VGLELDITVLRPNLRKSVFIAFVSVIIPFGVGSVIAVFIRNYVMPSVNVPVGSVILFIGVAFAITAFPVLARILTESKLLES